MKENIIRANGAMLCVRGLMHQVERRVELMVMSRNYRP